MPNKCTQCGKIHNDDAPYLLEGCNECGSKFFFYVRAEALQEILEDMDNVWAAWRWAVERGDVGTIGNVVEAWLIVGGGREEHAVSGIRGERDVVVPAMPNVVVPGISRVLAEEIFRALH